jgi:hypothetical protein
MRVGKQLSQPENLTKHRQNDSLKKSQLTLSHGVEMWGVVAAADDDD